MSGSAVDGIVNELGQRFLWLHLLLPSHLQGGERVEAQGKAAALKTLLHLASGRKFRGDRPKAGAPRYRSGAAGVDYAIRPSFSRGLRPLG